MSQESMSHEDASPRRHRNLKTALAHVKNVKYRGKRDISDDLGTFTGFLKRNHHLLNSYNGLDNNQHRFKRSTSDYEDIGGFAKFVKKDPELGKLF